MTFRLETTRVGKQYSFFFVILRDPAESLFSRVIAEEIQILPVDFSEDRSALMGLSYVTVRMGRATALPRTESPCREDSSREEVAEYQRSFSDYCASPS